MKKSSLTYRGEMKQTNQKTASLWPETFLFFISLRAVRKRRFYHEIKAKQRDLLKFWLSRLYDICHDQFLLSTFESVGAIL